MTRKPYKKPYTKEEALNKIYTVTGDNARGCRLFLPKCLSQCKVKLTEIKNEI